MSAETFQQTFTVTAPASLSVDNICGSVTISTGDDGAIAVTAVKHDNGDVKNTEVELTQLPDGKVKLATHFNHGGLFDWLFGMRPCDVDYTVSVPKNCTVKVNGVSCTISVTGIQGEVRAKSVSGEITLREIAGPVDADAVSGPVRGFKVAGALRVKTVSGEIDFDACDLPSVNADTVSGSIRLDTPLGAGPYGLHSVSGGASLLVPDDSTCTVEMHSVSGGFDSDLPMNTCERRNGHTRAQVQGGGVAVAFKTVSGGLRLESQGGPRPSVVTISRRELLGKIERGELTADQALAQLR